jgi:ABC-type glutathione transport system ATPase component
MGDGAAVRDGETERFVLLMYRRLTLEPLRAAGQLVVEGDPGLTTACDQHAVDDVTLTIAAGESLGLVGESGCGKSTLVRLRARLIDPTGGSIVCDGKEIGAISPGRFGRVPERGQLQVGFQDARDSLNPRFTAFDCIAESLRRLTHLPSRQDVRAPAPPPDVVVDGWGIFTSPQK